MEIQGLLQIFTKDLYLHWEIFLRDYEWKRFLYVAE